MGPTTAVALDGPLLTASTGERKYVRSLVVAGAGWRRTVTVSVPGHMTGRRVVPGGDLRPPESGVNARGGTRMGRAQKQACKIFARYLRPTSRGATASRRSWASAPSTRSG